MWPAGTIPIATPGPFARVAHLRLLHGRQRVERWGRGVERKVEPLVKDRPLRLVHGRLEGRAAHLQRDAFRHGGSQGRRGRLIRIPRRRKPHELQDAAHALDQRQRVVLHELQEVVLDLPDQRAVDPHIGAQLMLARVGQVPGREQTGPLSETRRDRRAIALADRAAVERHVDRRPLPHRVEAEGIQATQERLRRFAEVLVNATLVLRAEVDAGAVGSASQTLTRRTRLARGQTLTRRGRLVRGQTLTRRGRLVRGQTLTRRGRLARGQTLTRPRRAVTDRFHHPGAIQVRLTPVPFEGREQVALPRPDQDVPGSTAVPAFGAGKADLLWIIDWQRHGLSTG